MQVTSACTGANCWGSNLTGLQYLSSPDDTFTAAASLHVTCGTANVTSDVRVSHHLVIVSDAHALACYEPSLIDYTNSPYWWENAAKGGVTQLASSESNATSFLPGDSLHAFATNFSVRDLMADGTLQDGDVVHAIALIYPPARQSVNMLALIPLAPPISHSPRAATC